MHQELSAIEILRTTSEISFLTDSYNKNIALGYVWLVKPSWLSKTQHLSIAVLVVDLGYDASLSVFAKTTALVAAGDSNNRLNSGQSQSL